MTMKTIIALLLLALTGCTSYRVTQEDTSSAAAGFTDFFIWSDNVIAGLQNTSLAWYFGQNKAIGYGGYIANNIFTITTNSGPAVYNFGGSVYYHTNIVIHHNFDQ